MNFHTGEPTHIEDYLVTVREGCWFGWTDSKNKIYENLIVHDGGIKPTKEELAWAQIPWRSTFYDGLIDSDREQKPLLLWVMNGHPLGCT